MIDRRALITCLGAGLLAAPLAAAGVQAAGKIPRVGVLLSQLPDDAPYTSGLREGLRDLGYVESTNIVIEWRWAHGRTERLPELAAELVRLEVDVIVAGGTRAISVARAATPTIPIVMAYSADPVGQGFVASFARPGGNVTGLSSQTSEVHSKRLELLKEAFPRLSRIAALQDSTFPAVQEAEAAARALRVSLQRVRVGDLGAFDSAFAVIMRQRAEAVVVEASQLFVDHRKQISEFAHKNRLPTMCPARPYGCLMSYGVNWNQLFRRVATYVDKILKGAKPADLPVEGPTKFELIINLKTAKALGLTIPQSALLRADHIIQ